jgi:large subunit ribosomal protein L13
MKVYFDADGAVLGRIGSLACKDLLKGKEVAIINSEKVIISGSEVDIMGTLSNWREKGGIGLKGPRVLRSPDRLLKRMIRGMLPWDRPKGRAAYRRFRCYIGQGPLSEAEVKLAKKVEVKRPIKFVKLGDIAHRI